MKRKTKLALAGAAVGVGVLVFAARRKSATAAPAAPRANDDPDQLPEQQDDAILTEEDDLGLGDLPIRSPGIPQVPVDDQPTPEPPIGPPLDLPQVPIEVPTVTPPAAPIDFGPPPGVVIPPGIIPPEIVDALPPEVREQLPLPPTPAPPPTPLPPILTNDPVVIPRPAPAPAPLPVPPILTNDPVVIPRPVPVPAPRPAPAPRAENIAPDTLGLVEALLAGERKAKWGDNSQPALLKPWQSARKLTADGKLGPGTNLRIALEIGTLPLIRDWPRASGKSSATIRAAIDDYRKAVGMIAAEAPEPRRSQLLASARRETGQSFGPPHSDGGKAPVL